MAGAVLAANIAAMKRLLLLAVIASAMIVIPSTASAAVTCNLAGNALTVSITGATDNGAGLRLTNGNEIGVYDSSAYTVQQACGGGTPTTANTNSIAVADNEPGSTNRTVLGVSLANGPFVNSDSTNEGAGTKEIEIAYDGGEESSDDLVLTGAPGPAGDDWRMGQLDATHNGFQLDDTEPAANSDVDDLVETNVEQLQIGVNGNPGDDILDARGGTGSPARWYQGAPRSSSATRATTTCMRVTETGGASKATSVRTLRSEAPAPTSFSSPSAPTPTSLTVTAAPTTAASSITPTR